MTTEPVRPWSNQTSSRLATLSGLSNGHCARTPFAPRQGRLNVSSDIKKAWTSSRLVKKGPSVQYICSHTMKSIDEETSATVVESIRVSPGIKRTSTMPDGEAFGMVVEAVSVASDIKRASTSLVKKASSVQCCSATTTKPRMLQLPPVSVSVAASVNVDSTVLLKLPPCLEGGGTHLVFIHCPPGVLPPAVLEGKVAPSHHHLAPVDDGLRRVLAFCSEA
ncbi:unnamed protein product [Musa acuminata subsp. burmannicoides]